MPISDARPGAPLDDPAHKLPWTYRGPGLWWNATTQKIHARFAPTHYNQPGVTDYAGGADPRELSLSISSYGTVAISVEASHVTFKNIVFQNGGGGQTVSVYYNNAHVTFDHCTINAARYGVARAPPVSSSCRTASSTPTCSSYTSRSDVKDNWDINEAGLKKRVPWCSRTSEMQFVTNCLNQDLEIASGEFRNCHDALQVYDTRTRIHGCLFENVNDEVLSFEHGTYADDVCVYNNVIRKALSIYSFAQQGSVTGKRYIYRNVLDNRIRTRSARGSWRLMCRHRVPQRSGAPGPTSRRTSRWASSTAIRTPSSRGLRSTRRTAPCSETAI